MQFSSKHSVTYSTKCKKIIYCFSDDFWFYSVTVNYVLISSIEIINIEKNYQIQIRLFQAIKHWEIQNVNFAQYEKYLEISNTSYFCYRSYGSQLTLEIFRRNPSRNGSVPSVKRLSTPLATSGTLCSSSVLPVTSVTSSSNLVQRRPSTVCSTNTISVDYSRRKLQLPQVTFSSEVGNGVIVQLQMCNTLFCIDGHNKSMQFVEKVHIG